MIAIVCGGRDFDRKEFLYSILDELDEDYNFDLIVHGGARGADSLADDWAHDRGIDIGLYPADWEKHGKAAGPIRNAQMLEYTQPDLVIAFPGGKGTAHMVKIAREAGVEVIEVNDDRD